LDVLLRLANSPVRNLSYLSVALLVWLRMGDGPKVD
jgi:hypothetical protein